MNLSPKNKWRLKRILPFGVIWALGGLLYTIIEYGLLEDTGFYPSTRNPYDPLTALVINVPIGFVIGLLFGTLEVLFLTKLFRDKGVVIQDCTISIDSMSGLDDNGTLDKCY